MARKFNRTRNIQLEAYRVLTDPQVIDMLFKRRPWWMPKLV
jgi:hypothetical protein